MENRNEKDPQEKGSDELSKSVDGANVAEVDALAALASGKENAEVFITAASLIGSAVQAGVQEIATAHNAATKDIGTGKFDTLTTIDGAKTDALATIAFRSEAALIGIRNTMLNALSRIGSAASEEIYIPGVERFTEY